MSKRDPWSGYDIDHACDAVYLVFEKGCFFFLRNHQELGSLCNIGTVLPFVSCPRRVTSIHVVGFFVSIYIASPCLASMTVLQMFYDTDNLGFLLVFWAVGIPFA